MRFQLLEGDAIIYVLVCVHLVRLFGIYVFFFHFVSVYVLFSLPPFVILERRETGMD